MSDNESLKVGPQSKYNWMLTMQLELEPGVAHLATRGVQFTCTPESFTQVIYGVARQRGFAATVATFDTCVVYAFYRRSSYLRPNLQAYPVVKKMRNE